MLNEKLDNLSSIGDRQSVICVISCIQHGTTSLDSLQQYMFSKIGTRVTDTLHIVLLLESMGLVLVNDDDLTCSDKLTEIFQSNEDRVEELFLDLFIDYLLSENVMNLSYVEYDLLSDSYKLPSKSFRYRHAAYRNLLISFGALILRSDHLYDMSATLSRFLHRPGFVRKITQQRLKEILEAEELMGADGESFVLQFERQRLGRSFADNIKQVSLIDVAAGFDIASFNSACSSEHDRYIEVKTYKGEPHFHWSRNEKIKASLLRDHYYIYLVDYDRIRQSNYEPQMIQDPIKNIFESSEWSKTIDSYLIERTYPEEIYQISNSCEDE